jgi:hypothetical protein
MARAFGMIGIADVVVSADAGRAIIGLFTVLMMVVVDEGVSVMDEGLLLAGCEFEGSFGKCVQATAKEQMFEVAASSWLRALVLRQHRVSAIKMQCSDGKQVACCSLHR